MHVWNIYFDYCIYETVFKIWVMSDLASISEGLITSFFRSNAIRFIKF